MKVQKKRQIIWEKAIDSLSAGAYYLLAILWYKDIDVSDKSLMAITGTGISTHRKYKKELIDKGYVRSNQIGKGIFRYKVGEAINGC